MDKKQQAHKLSFTSVPHWASVQIINIITILNHTIKRFKRIPPITSLHFLPWSPKSTSYFLPCTRKTVLHLMLQFTKDKSTRASKTHLKLKPYAVVSWLSSSGILQHIPPDTAVQQLSFCWWIWMILTELPGVKESSDESSGHKSLKPFSDKKQCN